MASIELVELTKHYKQGKSIVRALDGVSLTIAAGEFVSIVGRSGSGKTTMLDLIGLLLKPTSGRVAIDGVDAITLAVVASVRQVVGPAGPATHEEVADLL